MKKTGNKAEEEEEIKGKKKDTEAVEDCKEREAKEREAKGRKGSEQGVNGGEIGGMKGMRKRRKDKNVR